MHERLFHGSEMQKSARNVSNILFDKAKKHSANLLLHMILGDDDYEKTAKDWDSIIFTNFNRNPSMNIEISGAPFIDFHFDEIKISVKVSTVLGKGWSETAWKTKYKTSEWIGRYDSTQSWCRCTKCFWSNRTRSQSTNECLLMNLSQKLNRGKTGCKLTNQISFDLFVTC